MKLGIGTYTFPWTFHYRNSIPFSYRELIDYAVATHISRVQICDNYPLHELQERELINLRDVANKNNIVLEAGTRRLTTENLSQYLHIAKILRSPFLRIVIDDAGYEPNVREVIDMINQSLPEFISNNVMLAIENHDRFPAKALKYIIEQTDKDWVTICLDTANSLGAGEGIDEVVAQLLPYVINLHIKDISIKRFAHKMGFMVDGVAAGEGIINCPGLISACATNGKCQSVTIELWSHEAETPEQTIKNEQLQTIKSIDYLKQFIQ